MPGQCCAGVGDCCLNGDGAPGLLPQTVSHPVKVNVVTRWLLPVSSLLPGPCLATLADNFPPSSLVVFRGCLSGDLNLPIYFKM